MRWIRRFCWIGLLAAIIVTTGVHTDVQVTAAPVTADPVSYVAVDTGQGICYDNTQPVACPTEGEAFYGQDAQYNGARPGYVDNGDGTVSDLNTGLRWQKSPDTDGDGDLDAADKLTYDAALAGADTFSLAGYDDWRLPAINEFYSLILFSGADVSTCMGGGTCSGVPFIDTNYFDFAYGDTGAGERIIDAQYWSSTAYVSTTMNGEATTFGINFPDGRIKGYGRTNPRGEMTQFVRYVRGNTSYGVNAFADNGDGTVTDNATGLMWMQTDSGEGMNWEGSLGYCESLDLAGYDDWRLPNAKELQSIVDYSRSPDTSNSAAIDPVFAVTTIINEAGREDYPFYWTGTTHADASGRGSTAVYVAFGRAMGYMHNSWMDVHGAGAQRSDPKAGDPADYPRGRGPQGDAIRIDNYARCVRGGNVTVDSDGDPTAVRSVVTIESQGVQTPAGGGLEQPGDGPQPPNGGPGPGGASEVCRPDLPVAASALNVTVGQLQEALGDKRQGPPDVSAAAARLEISTDALHRALRQAMPDCRQPGPPPRMGGPPGGEGAPLSHG